MTREEAAECINDFIDHFDELGFNPYYRDALEMAVRYLEADFGWETIIAALERNYPDDIFAMVGKSDLGARTLHALRWLTKQIEQRQPDPITGLVPCGCGGRAKQEDFFDGFFYFGAIKCPECEIEIRIPSITPEESSDRVKVAWNRAMGYKGGAE